MINQYIEYPYIVFPLDRQNQHSLLQLHIFVY